MPLEPCWLQSWGLVERCVALRCGTGSICMSQKTVPQEECEQVAEQPSPEKRFARTARSSGSTRVACSDIHWYQIPPWHAGASDLASGLWFLVVVAVVGIAAAITAAYKAS